MTEEKNTFYDANMAILEARFSDIWNRVNNLTGDLAGEVVYTPDGNPNLKVHTPEGQQVFLHDENDPLAEVPLFLKMVMDNATGVVTLLGMGLGYTPLALVRERPFIRHLIVVELNLEIFRAALHLMDLSDLFSDPRLVLHVGEDYDLMALMAPVQKALTLEAIHNLIHLPSFAVNQTAYDRLNDAVYGYTNSRNIDGNTKFTHGQLFLGNRFRHLTSLHHDHLLESIKGEFKGLPAIIVAGGPSLDKNIHLLTAVQDRAVIIAVDTVVPALLANGVTPHFITSIDYQDITYEKLAPVIPMVHDAFLVCLPWVTAKVPKYFQARKRFWLWTMHYIDSWINTMMGGALCTGGAQTVAHLNLLCAMVLECSPIVFIGQDLAYDCAHSHSRHVVLSTQDDMERLLQSNEVLWVRGVNKAKVPTNRSMASMLKTFERMIQDVPGHYIDATQGGALIKGTEIMDLDKVIKQYCTTTFEVTTRVKQRLDGVEPVGPARIISELQAVKTRVDRCEKWIKESDKLANQVRQALSALEQKGQHPGRVSALPRRIQEMLNRIDACHDRIDGEKKVWQILEDITLEGLRQSERMRFDIDRLANHPETFMAWVRKSLERLDAINGVRTQTLSCLKEMTTTTLDHLKAEKSLIKKVKKTDKVSPAMAALGELYFNSGDMTLAKAVLEGFDLSSPDSAGPNYYLGAIAAIQTEYDKSNTCFDRALALDPEFNDRIRQFRTAWAEQYLALARQYRSLDVRIFKRMLLKGIRCCKDHQGLTSELHSVARQDLARLDDILDKSETAGQDLKMLDDMVTALDDEKNQSKLLEPEKVKAFYVRLGKECLSKGDQASARKQFEKALAKDPLDPEIHILLLDLFFSQGDFSQGIHHLKLAVAQDRSHARHWETIGDTLAGAAQWEDALVAYDTCFRHLPEQIGLLKKQAQCHLALDNLEVAHATLRRLKQLMENP